MLIKTVRTYTLELLNFVLHHGILPSLLAVSEMAAISVWRGPQAKRVQKLTETIHKSPRVGFSAHFREFLAVSLQLRNLGLFNRLEPGNIGFFSQTSSQLLVAPGRNTEHRKRLCNFIIITSIDIWIEVGSVLFFGEFLVKLFDSGGEILPNRTSRIFVPAGDSYRSSQLQSLRQLR